VGNKAGVLRVGRGGWSSSKAVGCPWGGGGGGKSKGYSLLGGVVALTNKSWRSVSLGGGKGRGGLAAGQMGWPTWFNLATGWDCNE